MGFFFGKVKQKAVECNISAVFGRELAEPIISNVRTQTDDGRGQPSRHTATYTCTHTLKRITKLIREASEKTTWNSECAQQYGMMLLAYFYHWQQERRNSSLQQEQAHQDTTQHEHYKMRDESQAQRLFSTTPNHNSLPSFFFFATIPLLPVLLT